jgi:hypothetical protein
MDSHDEQLRAEAIASLKRRRTFWKMLTTYLVMNTFFVVIWVLTGAGYFWPGWVLAGWGLGVAFSAVHAFTPAGSPESPTEQQIQDEVRKRRDRDAA